MICWNKTLRVGQPTDKIPVKTAERICVITSKSQNITEARATIWNLACSMVAKHP